MYTGQRFDGYEGVSCMVHSEGYEDGGRSGGRGKHVMLYEDGTWV